MVCSMTRGPVKPIRALGSAIIASPKEAKLANTPAIVGLVRTEINKSLFWLCRERAADVFAICIKDNIPSCILAPPPEPETMTKGRFEPVANSIARVNFSPTTEPIEPIINRESVTPRIIFFSQILPFPTTQASDKSVLFFSSDNFCL